MKASSVGAALVAATMCFSSIAVAQHRPFHGERPAQRHIDQRADGRGEHRQRRDFRNDRHRGEHRFDRRQQRRIDRIEHRREHRQARRHWRHWQHRPFYGYRAAPPPRAHWHGHRGAWRGAGPQHRLYRGGRLPPQYRSHHYVVRDWRHYHLSPPPRGYHWVHTGADFVLAAIATGLILQIAFGGY